LLSWRAHGWFTALGVVLLTSACSGGLEQEEGWPLSEIQTPDSAQMVPELGVDGGELVEDTLAGDVPLASEVMVEGSPGDGGVVATSDPAGVEPEGAVARPYRLPMGMSASEGLVQPTAPPGEDFKDARFPRPTHIRGLYMNAWAAGSNRRMTEMLEVAAATEVNALVIDIKDATGFISHDTNLELARDIGADGEIRIRDLPALLDRLEEAGIYPIARIVVVKDPILAAARPQTAVQDTAGGVWIDSKEIIWQNLFNEELWAYNVALAREVAEMGFPEVQWDYIRFPDAPVSDMERAVFVGGEDRLRVDAVRGFLSYAREELADLPVRSTADVFGVTTSFRRDIGIGQLWETFIDVVDVALPMVYPSHYWEGSFGYTEPNAYPYEIVYAALRDALRRSGVVDGAGLTRPWLQDFSLGQPAYGAAEVRAQIQATYDVGIQEWILWNPSTRYSVAALEPAQGFDQDPLVRVAGVISATSRRYEVMDSVAAFELAMFEAAEAAEASAAENVEGLGEVEDAATTMPDQSGADPGDLPSDRILPVTDSVAPVDTTSGPSDR